MRLVIDTNQLVRLLARREGILWFKQLTFGGGVVHVTSRFVLEEVERVLRRRFHLTKRQAISATRFLKRHSVLVKPSDIPHVCRDPDDDHVLAAALMGKADYIVTADADLLVLGVYQGVLIISPAEIDSVLQ